MSIDQPRQPAGVPTGGQFAATAHTEPDITLHRPVRDIDDAVTNAAGVVRAIEYEVERATIDLTAASSHVMSAAKEQVGLSKRANADELERAEGRCKRALADEADARERLEHANDRLGRARAELDAAAAQYPWAGGGGPVIDLAGRGTRPVVVAPSGTFGFFEPPRYGFLGTDHRSVAIAQCINGTWHPTGGSYCEDDIRGIDPGRGLAIDSGAGWGLDAADAAAFRDFAHQEGLQ